MKENNTLNPWLTREPKQCQPRKFLKVQAVMNDTYKTITNTVSSTTVFWLMCLQVGDFCLGKGPSTVPLTWLSCNTGFSKSQIAGKAGNFCTTQLAWTGPNLSIIKIAHLMTYIKWLWREQWTQDGVVVSDPINHQVFTQWHVSIWKSLPGCLGIQITLESISSLIMCLHFWRFMSILVSLIRFTILLQLKLKEIIIVRAVLD